MSRNDLEFPFRNPIYSHANLRSKLAVKLVENTFDQQDVHGAGFGSSIDKVCRLLSIVSNDLSCQHGKDIN